MGKAPETCLYCKGSGEGPGSPCGFCENGKPLDTQEDWDKSWGRVEKFIEKTNHGDWHNKYFEEMGWLDELRQRKIVAGSICGGCGEWPEFCDCEGTDSCQAECCGKMDRGQSKEDGV